MKLNGETIFVNDRVFDISTQRGYGKVTRIMDNTFEVKFDRYSVVYDSDGIQTGKLWQTLFWEKPLIINPSKNEQNWSTKRELVGEFFKIVKDYKDFI